MKRKVMFYISNKDSTEWNLYEGVQEGETLLVNSCVRTQELLSPKGWGSRGIPLADVNPKGVWLVGI